VKIATILLSHANTELTRSTVESIKRWVGPDFFIVIDGVTWNSWGKDAKLGAAKLHGVYHDHPVSPHRNIVLGLQSAFELWPNADWFCCTEYNVFFGNDSFKEDLQDADERGIWCIGNDYREEHYNMSFLEGMFHIKFKGSRHLLGCCFFLNGKFVKKLADINFFATFIKWTNPLEKGFIPYFQGYSFVEYLFPTMASYFGGKVEQFARWNQRKLMWEGKFRRYPIRFTPTLDPVNEYFEEASILHPLKDVNHVFRMMYRRKPDGKYSKI
jgi:hypothetical protein